MTEAVKGLQAIRAMQEEDKRKAAERDRPKAEWFKWPDKSTSTATVRFLQELDESADNYSESRGLGFIQVEHQAPGPDGFKRRANCTAESEGQCYACERHAMRIEADQGGWRQRKNLYINALVSFGGEAPKVMVMSRNANATFTNQLIEEAVDENTITAKNYKVTKTGEGTTTQWLLKALKDEPFSDSSVEVFDLAETAVRAIPYEKQAEYYGAVYGGGELATAGAPASGGSTDTSAEW
jgi:hypothetical protein